MENENTAMEQEIRPIPVLADRLFEARKVLDKLIKKAHKYGCPDITYTVGPVRYEIRETQDWDGEKRKVKVAVNDLIVTGQAPKIGNHEFLARIEINKDGNMIDAKPGVEDRDHRFRSVTGFCDHCQKTRSRNDVFVVRDLETGKQLQIGRQCLREYLGVDPASAIYRFTHWSSLAGIEKEFYGSGLSAWGQSLEGILTLTSVCVRLFGWCSGAQANNSDGRLTATMVYVRLGLPDARDLNKDQRDLRTMILEAKTDADVQMAKDTIAWVRSLGHPDNDYLYNLTVQFKNDFIDDPKRFGLVVSAISAYHRHMDKELRKTEERKANLASVHIGEVGKRMKGIKAIQDMQMVVGAGAYGDIVLVKFKTEEGNLISWFTSHGTGLERGEKVVIDGTVKEHKVYKDIPETQMSRVTIKGKW
jgi:hypothetical protein